MTFSTIKHRGACSEDKPCTNCRGTQFLRDWMEPGAFPVFRSIIGESSSPALPEVIRKLVPVKASAEPDPQPEPVTGTLLSSVKGYDDLDVRVVNCLRNDNIQTVEQLLKISRQDLMRTPNFGKISLGRLRAFLTQAGYDPPWEA